MVEKLKPIIFLLMLTFLFAIKGMTQDYTWWNEIHGWEEGMPGWKAFMIISPGYLGINALPVPTQIKGEIPIRPELETAIDLHFLPGERAQNMYIRYLHSFANGRIAVEVFGVPVEHSDYNQEIRDERKSRVESGEEWEVGDLYFATHIKILDEKKWKPSAVLRMACKTASGDLYGARFTDTPAYWFDLSAGKTFNLSKKLTLRPFAMGGLYVWQTTSSGLLQNDAKLWGGGAEAQYKKFCLEQSLQGYNGWRDEKDCPMNYRAILSFKIRNNDLKIEYQHGIRDVLYKSLRIACVFKF